MVPARAARYGSPSRLLAWLRVWLLVQVLVWLLAQVLSANPKFRGHGRMPYVAQNGVCCGFRANFVAEATKIANSSCRCHISVASEFRVGTDGPDFGLEQLLRISGCRPFRGIATEPT